MSGGWKQDNRKKYGWRGGNRNQNAHKSSFGGSSLAPGMKGFICTYTDKTRTGESVRHAYSLLNEFADIRYGKQTESWRKPPEQPGDVAKEEGVEEDVDASLEAELASLKEENAKPASARRFQSAGCDVNCVAFIQSTIEDPCELAKDIMESLAESKQQRSKLLARILPVQITCKANMEDIMRTAGELLPKYFTEGGKTFSVLFSHKYNDKVTRDQVIDEVAKAVVALNETNKVDLKSADLTIMVDIMRTVCCMAVIPDYFKYKKYNIMELCVDKEKTEGKVELETANVDEGKEGNASTVEVKIDGQETGSGQEDEVTPTAVEEKKAKVDGEE